MVTCVEVPKPAEWIRQLNYTSKAVTGLSRATSLAIASIFHPSDRGEERKMNASFLFQQRGGYKKFTAARWFCVSASLTRRLTWRFWRKSSCPCAGIFSTACYGLSAVRGTPTKVAETAGPVLAPRDSSTLSTSSPHAGQPPLCTSFPRPLEFREIPGDFPLPFRKWNSNLSLVIFRTSNDRSHLRTTRGHLKNENFLPFSREATELHSPWNFLLSFLSHCQVARSELQRSL